MKNKEILLEALLMNRRAVLYATLQTFLQTGQEKAVRTFNNIQSTNNIDRFRTFFTQYSTTSMRQSVIHDTFTELLTNLEAIRTEDSEETKKGDKYLNLIAEEIQQHLNELVNDKVTPSNSNPMINMLTLINREASQELVKELTQINKILINSIEQINKEIEDLENA